ncbi:hypothetical protein MLOOGBEN_05105 [Bacillus sp. EB106-08-02-XG196]|uniref:hypothetical protein n=1 Tax=Bacillus sp. EB106-08-02-XG196 TaxID=2737049 RepID=UPI0015C4A0CE|nr:hypothetical protein [Bacillus sp. EB106-08-02-XG196]NWQ40073.1 hypothetical protein [Bacillus sp. EB106-08-02-XG196]
METILFLIIAGILSSIFGKAKGKSNPGRRTKTFPAKGFDDFRTKVEQQMMGIPRNKGQISTGQPAKQSNMQSMEEKYQEIKQIPVISKTQVKQMQPSKPARIEVESDDIPFEKPGDKTIINGIIWAEILGEPRAKKPYFPRKS